MPNLTTYQRAWLRQTGLDSPELLATLKTCDPDRGTITLNDGRVRQYVETYTRVMGYHRPTMAFNAGKQQEHRDRKQFRECMLS